MSESWLRSFERSCAISSSSLAEGGAFRLSSKDFLSASRNGSALVSSSVSCALEIDCLFSCISASPNPRSYYNPVRACGPEQGTVSRKFSPPCRCPDRDRNRSCPSGLRFYDSLIRHACGYWRSRLGAKGRKTYPIGAGAPSASCCARYRGMDVKWGGGYNRHEKTTGSERNFQVFHFVTI